MREKGCAIIMPPQIRGSGMQSNIFMHLCLAGIVETIFIVYKLLLNIAQVYKQQENMDQKPRKIPAYAARGRIHARHRKTYGGSNR